MNEQKLSALEQILSIQSETRTVEFKRLGSRNETVDRTLESVVAMSNTDGGLIVLGIDDPEKTSYKGLSRVFGIEENLNLYDELSKNIRKIIPPLSNIWPPQLINVKEKNARVGLLLIPKGTDLLRSIENHVFIRLEKGNKRLTPSEIIHYSYVKGFQRADKELVNVDIRLLDTPHYESWRKNRNINDPDIFIVLEKTGLARKEGDFLKPTRAAVLLFAEYPNDLMDTKCTVRVFQYEGNIETISETLNLTGTPKTIDGPVIDQINNANDFILNQLREGIRVSSGFITKYAIPSRAIQEAVTNAVIHRDYHTKRDIEVRIFEDRVEIESPGLFPYNITAWNIGIERAHGYRNDLLVKHLREFPQPPNLDQNEGVKAIKSVMAKANLYPPLFFTYPNIQDAVRVVLFNEKAPNEWEKVLHFLSKSKFITNEEARNITMIPQRDKMSKLLKKWVNKGLLVKIQPRSGYVKATKYKLPESEQISNLLARGNASN